MTKLRGVDKEALDELADALYDAVRAAADCAVCWCCVRDAIRNCEEAAREDGEVEELSPCPMRMDFSAPVPDMSGEVDPVEVKDVADRLMCAFSWASTPQGHGWWAKVYMRLGQIVDSVQAPGEKDRKEKLDALPSALISAFLFSEDSAVNWAAIYERLCELRDGRKGPTLEDKGLDSPVPVMQTLSDGQKAAALLFDAFDWASTAEGGAFWYAVHKRLLSFKEQLDNAAPEPEEAPTPETLSFEY